MTGHQVGVRQHFLWPFPQTACTSGARLRAGPTCPQVIDKAQHKTLDRHHRSVADVHYHPVSAAPAHLPPLPQPVRSREGSAGRGSPAAALDAPLSSPLHQQQQRLQQQGVVVGGLLRGGLLAEGGAPSPGAVRHEGLSAHLGAPAMSASPRSAHSQDPLAMQPSQVHMPARVCVLFACTCACVHARVAAWLLVRGHCSSHTCAQLSRCQM